MVSLHDVFGVSNSLVKSYVERGVDSRIKNALISDKQIVVYGSSKQGKTALVSRHLSYTNNIVVNPTPNSDLADVYHSVLRQSGILLKHTGFNIKAARPGINTKQRTAVALFCAVEDQAGAAVKPKTELTETYRNVTFNLESPQDIGELLKKVGNEKFIILENFHYLSKEKQKQFSYDLRIFQEMGIRFVILGVWRERDRISQFNVDLLDRVEEIAVEPWSYDDFRKIAYAGSEALNVFISDTIIEQCADAALGSVGIFQELMKEVCMEAGVVDDSVGSIGILNERFLQRAVETKTREYSGRHLRALESIASGLNPSSTFYLPYYLVKVIIENGPECISTGITKNALESKIKGIHPKSDEIKTADITQLLNSLIELQLKKDINPPILGYDNHTGLLLVVDSTFNFFINNTDLKAVLRNLQKREEAFYFDYESFNPRRTKVI